jgi:hypothetical protein
MTTLWDQFLIGLLNETLEESALEFETDLMDERLYLVGEMLILIGHRRDHLRLEYESEGLTRAADGAEGNGSLKIVGVTHNESHCWRHGVHRASFLLDCHRHSSIKRECECFPKFGPELPSSLGKVNVGDSAGNVGEIRSSGMDRGARDKLAIRLDLENQNVMVQPGVAAESRNCDGRIS